MSTFPDRFIPSIRSCSNIPSVPRPTQVDHRFATFYHTLEAFRVHFKQESAIKKLRVKSLHRLDGCLAYNVEVREVIKSADLRVFGMLSEHRLPDFGGVGLE